MDVSIGDETVTITDGGRQCGVYHYANLSQPFYKSFFRGLYTPGGKDVVAPPPSDHPHHHGLQFGLCLSDVNFWEESTKSEPSYNQLPIGRQQTESLQRGPGIGFSQQVRWDLDGVASFLETRTITVTTAPGAFVWTWKSTLRAQRNVEIITSAWRGPGYCGLGLRLKKDLFQNGKVVPATMRDGSIPTSVSFVGDGATVTFAQSTAQQNALFVSFYDAEPWFAFLALGPTNLSPRGLARNQSLDGSYVVTVADQ